MILAKYKAKLRAILSLRTLLLITTYLTAKPKQRSNPSLENNYNTASDNNIYKRCKHFYSILSSDFREEEFLSEEYFGFWLALNVLPSKRFARDYRIREGFMLVHEEEKCFSLHKLEALTKTFQHLSLIHIWRCRRRG